MTVVKGLCRGTTSLYLDLWRWCLMRTNTYRLHISTCFTHTFCMRFFKNNIWIATNLPVCKHIIIMHVHSFVKWSSTVDLCMHIWTFFLCTTLHSNTALLSTISISVTLRISPGWGPGFEQCCRTVCRHTCGCLDLPDAGPPHWGYFVGRSEFLSKT